MLQVSNLHTVQDTEQGYKPETAGVQKHPTQQDSKQADWPPDTRRDEGVDDGQERQRQHKASADAQAEQDLIRRRDSVAFDPSLVTDDCNKQIHNESYKIQSC